MSLEPDEPDTQDIPENPSVAAMVVAGGIVAAATAAFGPPGAIAGAALTPVAEHLLEKAANEWRREGQCKAGVVLVEAADEMGVEVDDLLERVSRHPVHLTLLAHAMDAAARTSLEAKVRMLGSALASGVLAADDAKVDEAQLKVGVLQELEAPHLKVLQAIDEKSRHSQGIWTGASEQFLADVVADRSGMRSSGVLQPILRTLDRNGLIYQSAMGDVWDEHAADDFRADAGANEWTSTIFGRDVLSDYTAKRDN